MVENATPVFSERKFDAEVVEKKSFAVFQKFDDVVEKKKPLSMPTGQA